MENILTIVGLCGVAVALVTYGLLTTGRLSSDDARYPLLNILGTLLIAASLLYQWNLPALMSQLLWIVISVVALVRIYRRRSS